MISGIVTAVHPSFYLVHTEDYGAFNCELRGKLLQEERQVVRPVAVGDRVRITKADDHHAAIEEIKERRNKISRRLPDQQTREQILAANIDCVVAVQSVRKPHVRNVCLDQCLAASERFGIEEAIVCVNKKDLLDESWKEWRKEYLPEYESLGYSLVTTSVKWYQEDTVNRENGVKELRQEIQGKTAYFVGPSGAGKSSLINVLTGEGAKSRQTGEVSRHDLGRHTTSASKMMRMNEDSWVIDTPGLEMLPMWQTKPGDLEPYFPEIFQCSKSCQFSDCRHRSEPNCAVKEAVQHGRIHERRLESYHTILEELETRAKEAPWE